MASNFDVNLVILVAGQIIGLCIFVWRIAIEFGLLKAQIERNRNDLNGAMLSVREDLRNIYQIQQMQISHIQEHLQKNKDDNYHPPSLRMWDKNFET